MNCPTIESKLLVPGTMCNIQLKTHDTKNCIYFQILSFRHHHFHVTINISADYITRGEFDQKVQTLEQHISIVSRMVDKVNHNLLNLTTEFNTFKSSAGKGLYRFTSLKHSVHV